jgi:hypothetical protein
VSSRGIRNNNPLNIDKSDVKFQGLAPSQPDERFWTFLGPEWGLRAGAKILLTYEAHGFVTVRQIVSRWAPPSENNTTAYVDDVAKHMGVEPDLRIDVRDSARMVPLLEALVQHENGCQPYPMCTFIKAVQLAGLVVKAAAA